MAKINYKPGQGRDTAAIVIDIWVLFVNLADRFYFLEADRKVKSDLEIWIEYTKSIERLKKSDIYTKRQNPKYIEKPKVSNNDNYDLALSCIVNKRKNENLFVSILNKLERRRFRSEATIDLHGYTRNIDPTLKNFCLKCIVNNIKNIVIISGKGGGILKEAVENWLNSNPNIILGFFEIKDSQGQSGAFGVRLRSK